MTMGTRQPLVADWSARIGWTVNYGAVVFAPGEPWLVVSLVPEFPGCSSAIGERGIVWDLEALIASVRKPGAYHLITCECGYADHAGLTEPVLVSHPDDGSVVWELDVAGSGPALADGIGADGYLRLRFERDEYDAAVRSMLREVQALARSPLPVETLRGHEHYMPLLQEYPGLTHVPAGQFDPGFRSGDDIDLVAAEDADAPWCREPLFPPGTLIEVGLFGTVPWRVDGAAPLDWIGRTFTRWQVLAAFRGWLETVTCRFALPASPVAHGLGDKSAADRTAPRGTPAVGPPPDPNEWVLRPGRDAAEARAAGRAFAAAWQRGLAEGNTASGVEVRYVG